MALPLAARLCLQGHVSTDTDIGILQHGRTELIPSYNSSSSCLNTIAWLLKHADQTDVS